MNLKIESDHLQDYLGEIPPVIRFNTPLIREQIIRIESQASTQTEKAKLAFETARDQISHSFDIQSMIITITAEDTLEKKEVICFAKSHLLASLLRGMGIPAGFCYQRVMRKGTVESGYALHGLNALYLERIGWFRVDPRGNKPGINSQFSTGKEQLAYPIRAEYGEVDYPDVLTAPLSSVIRAMTESADCQALFYNRPDNLYSS